MFFIPPPLFRHPLKPLCFRPPQRAVQSLLCLLFSLFSGHSFAAPDPATVLVLANAASRDSLRVAKDYLRQRQIPPSNLIALPLELGESIEREAFIQTLYNPLLAHLMENGMVEAFDGGLDSLGRKRLTVLKNPYRYLVLCYGVPVHVKETDSIGDDAAWRRSALKAHPALSGQFESGPLAKNEASVDGELALMLRRDQPLSGFVPNPFFQNQQPSGITDLLKVCRLDGPSARASLHLVTSALRAERNGLAGRAYVDEDGRQGAYLKGNQWLQNCAKLFTRAGFDLCQDTAAAPFAITARFDAPVLYAGWYARHLTGPPTMEGFRFPDGAIAAHLHSFSASPLRSESQGWVGPLVHRGVAATFGNVAEPYLDFTHHFDAFFAALLNGWSLADAAYFAQPTLSWQNIVVGDPLYQPFKVGIEDQLARAGDPLRLLQDQYVYMRAVNLKLADNDSDAALALAQKGMRSAPGPALALRLAQLLQADTPEAAVQSLAFTARLNPISPDSRGLMLEIAQSLASLNEPALSLDIFQTLINPNLSPATLAAFLRKAIPAAQAANNLELSSKWATQLSFLEQSTLSGSPNQ